MNKLLSTIIPENLLRYAKKLYLNIRGSYYYGNKYHCPICEHNFRKMLPGGFDLEVVKQKEIIGSGLRENNICPYCQSTDRDRLVYLFLKNKTNILSEKTKVLHMSPEPALYNKINKLKNIEYSTGTKYSEGIYYHKNIQSLDLLNLALPNDEFDIIICNHVLEHIIDDNKAMLELFRVLKPGGTAILQVPISNQLTKTYEDITITDEKSREIHFGQFDHVRIYGKDYSQKLEKAGFKVLQYDPQTDNAVVNDNNTFALNQKEKLFVGSKVK